MSKSSSAVKTLPLRSEIDEKYKWDDKCNYSSLEEWKEDVNKLDDMVKPLESFEGHLHEGPEKVIEVFRICDEVSLKLHYLDVYSSIRLFEDNGDSEAQGMDSSLTVKSAEIDSKESWIEPELLSLPDEKLKEYREFEGMQKWLRKFDTIVRFKPHTLSALEEKLISSADPALSASKKSYTMLMDADITFSVITNEKGESEQLTRGNYRRFLESFDRETRKKAWGCMHDSLVSNKNTICCMLDGQIKSEVFYAKAYKYPSCVERSLFKDNIPLSVYTSLIEAMHQSLPSFHRYLAVRQRVMKLPSLDMYDLYVPLVKDYELKVPYEQAVEWSLEALKPLGEEYCEVARKALVGGERWADVYETKGKRSNACSIFNYRKKHYMCLNYNDTLDAAFTMMHELGHSMHGYYSSMAQPYHTAHYSLAVAEIASTLNEALLNQYLLDKARKEGNKEMEISLVYNKCDNYKGTVIRQIQFAEFDLAVHRMAEKGEPLTPDSLTKLYKDINDVYYGDQCLVKDGKPEFPHVLKADPRIAYEFMRVPHFFLNFYVYKYATSMCVSELIAKKILAGDAEATEKYFGLLKAGRSKDPIDIIKDAGVDLTTPQPFIDGLKDFDNLVNELDKLLN